MQALSNRLSTVWNQVVNYLDSFNIISTSDFGGRHLEFLSTVPYPCTVSGMVANVGVALESIRYLSVQHFHFRLGVRHFEFR